MKKFNVKMIGVDMIARMPVVLLEDEDNLLPIWIGFGGEELVKIDGRPSDMIALALRLDIPVYATDAVLGQATLLKKSNYDTEELDKFLKSLKPEDFKFKM